MPGPLTVSLLPHSPLPLHETPPCRLWVALKCPPTLPLWLGKHENVCPNPRSSPVSETSSFTAWVAGTNNPDWSQVVYRIPKECHCGPEGIHLSWSWKHRYNLEDVQAWNLGEASQKQVDLQKKADKRTEGKGPHGPDQVSVASHQMHPDILTYQRLSETWCSFWKFTELPNCAKVYRK
jgi:hypothetical protein